MPNPTELRDRLQAVLDRDRGARFARLQRDLSQQAPLVGDWSSMMSRRGRDYRISGRLQELAAELGFETGYNTELDNCLTQEGYTLSERGAIKRRIENGYLRDLGRPDETGQRTPPRAFLQALLTSMGEPWTESGINACLRRLAALAADVSLEFATIYDEAKRDPHEARTKLSAMRAKGEMPSDRLGWAKSDFDGADRFEWGDFEVRTTTATSNAVKNKDEATSINEMRDPSFEAERGASEPDNLSTPMTVSYPSKTTKREVATTNGTPSVPTFYVRREVDAETHKQSTESADQSDSIEADQASSPTGTVTNSLTEITESLIAHKGRTWDRKTADQHRAVAKMLAGIARSDDLRRIKHQHLNSYVQNLANLPKSYGKSSRDKDRSIWDLIARGTALRAAGQDEKVGLSPPTINRHITQLSTIAKYCCSNERPIGQVDLLSDLRLIDPEHDGDKRPAFERDDLNKLFSHAVWTSSLSDDRTIHMATTQEIFAAVYWLPLLGCYTCARLSELTYLNLGDISLNDRSIKITPTNDRRVKNRASVRTIPIHPELLRLGFLDFVRSKMGSSQDRLFSDIALLGEKTSLSNLFYKRWIVVLGEAVPSASEEEKTFHSFRHFGNTEMIRQCVIDPIRETIMGHEGKTVNTRIYKKNLGPADLRSAVATIPNLTKHLLPYDWVLIKQVLEGKPGPARSRPRSRRVAIRNSAKIPCPPAHPAKSLHGAV